MIARSLILFLLLIVIPDAYLYRVWVRHGRRSWPKVAWWAVSVLLVAYTLWLAFTPDFMPANPWWLFAYLLILGVYTLPKALFALLLPVAGGVRRLQRLAAGADGSAASPQNARRASMPGTGLSTAGKEEKPARWAVGVAAALSAALIGMVGYGVTEGFYKFEVRQLDYSSPQVPPAFDGYRVALFSDAHVGSYLTGRGQRLLAEAMDSLNALGADLIVFTGDLQNVRAQEIAQHQGALSSLKAPDGVMAVLGNHDYAMYIRGTNQEKATAEEATIRQIQTLGWDLLRNEHRCIARGGDTLVVGGMENYGKPPFPSRGNVEQTLQGVEEGSFILLLEHDPYAWQHEILPKSRAQLTLSGHTHGGQIKLGSFSPYAVIGGEYAGLYHQGDRTLFVTRGLGGLIPLRVGATGEIVLITLHRTPATGATPAVPAARLTNRP